MLQRTGLAAALVADPEMLILDEPMSGLDPVGRKEVRDLIFAERDRGADHLLLDATSSATSRMCDRVCILREGKVVVSGRIDELLGQGNRHSEVSLRDVTPDIRDELAKMGHVTKDLGEKALAVDVEGDDAVRTLLKLAIDRGARVESVTPKRETLESLFVRRAL